MADDDLIAYLTELVRRSLTAPKIPQNSGGSLAGTGAPAPLPSCAVSPTVNGHITARVSVSIMTGVGAGSCTGSAHRSRSSVTASASG